MNAKVMQMDTSKLIFKTKYHNDIKLNVTLKDDVLKVKEMHKVSKNSIIHIPYLLKLWFFFQVSLITHL